MLSLFFSLSIVLVYKIINFYDQHNDTYIHRVSARIFEYGGNGGLNVQPLPQTNPTKQWKLVSTVVSAIMAMISKQSLVTKAIDRDFGADRIRVCCLDPPEKTL